MFCAFLIEWTENKQHFTVPFSVIHIRTPQYTHALITAGQASLGKSTTVFFQLKAFLVLCGLSKHFNLSTSTSLYNVI